MIITKTPLRMSFVGGGSDLAHFYREHGGAVISTSINKYIYISINPKFDEQIRISYAKMEETHSVGEIKHQLVREILHYLKIKKGIEIAIIADVPSKGTGLGSSSSFVVGLLHGLHAYLNQPINKHELSQLSCKMEIDLCGEPIGKQDQYAASCGGFNLIEFNPDESVKLTPITCSSETMSTLQNHLILFYTGLARSASTILEELTTSLKEKRKAQHVSLKQMVQLTYDLHQELQNNNYESLGYFLHENWLLKKSLVRNISNPHLDACYESARKAGAIGGKILGAGAGGFLLLYAVPETHAAIIRALSDLKHVPFQFENLGSQIIYQC